MTKEIQLKTVSDKLSSLLKKHTDAMPANFNQTRFIQNCLTVLSETKDIEKCDPVSVARTMIKGAFLGLDFFTRECYAICYGGKLQFQTDYKGEVKLAKKYSINPIKEIYTKLVREGDSFEDGIQEGLQFVNFTPKPFNDGEVIGVFAVAYFKDGSMIYETMSKKEMEETRRNYSKQSSGQAWTKSRNEMYRKTVSRRLCKLIGLEFERSEQDQAFRDGSDVDQKKFTTTVNVKHKVSDPFAPEPTTEENEESSSNEKVDTKETTPEQKEIQAIWDETPTQETEAESPKENIISEAQRKRFFAIYKGNGYDDDEVKAYIGAHHKFKSTKDITRDKYEEICNRFEQKKG